MDDGTYLKYDDPIHLYNLARQWNETLICVDVGSESTGICVLYPEYGSSRPIAKLPAYSRTPFEVAIVDECRQNASGDPHPNYIQEGELLPIQHITLAMNEVEMSNILKRVSSDHRSFGFVFGYSCSPDHWNNPANYSHIRNMLGRLNNLGDLYPRLFTLADEYGLTNRAKGRLDVSLPNLDTQMLFNRHHENYEDARVLRDELSDFRKAYIDCYSAMVFGEASLSI